MGKIRKRCVEKQKNRAYWDSYVYHLIHTKPVRGIDQNKNARRNRLKDYLPVVFINTLGVLFVVFMVL